MNENRTTLEKLKVGDKAKILKVDSLRSKRLMEMGLIEGAEVEVMIEAPFGKDPIAVKTRGGLIALRRSEASEIEVTQGDSHE